jgi:DnaK suppressor protein
MSKKNSKNKPAKKAKKAPAKSKSSAKAKTKVKAKAKTKAKKVAKKVTKKVTKKVAPKAKAKKAAVKGKAKPAKATKTKVKATAKKTATKAKTSPKPKTKTAAKPKSRPQSKPVSKPQVQTKPPVMPMPENLPVVEAQLPEAPETSSESSSDEPSQEDSSDEGPSRGKKVDKGNFHNAAKEYNPFLYDNLNKPKPMKPTPNPDERSRYSEEELKEFEVLIADKLEAAKKELTYIKEVLSRKHDPGTDTTAGTLKLLEDGADTAEKENFTQLAARQQKFIQQLENAMARIKNGTYGICVETGKLIPKERLRAVPHTQHSIEAKLNRKD